MFSELDKRNNCKHGQSAQILLRNCRRNNEQDELGETQDSPKNCLSIAVVDYKKAIKTETTSVKERESDIDEIHLTGIK